MPWFHARKNNVRLAGFGRHLFLQAQLRVFLTLLHVYSHGSNAGKECADHAAALGALGLVSKHIFVERWSPPRFNTTALLGNKSDLADIEPHFRNLTCVSFDVELTLSTILGIGPYPATL